MDRLARLVAWLSESGAVLDGVVVREGGVGPRGVFATRPIAAGTAILRIPRALMITREAARRSSIGRQIVEAGVELSGTHSLLAAWMLAERSDPRSPFHPYFETLPRELGGFPIGFGAAELELLAGSLAEELLREQREAIAGDHARLRAVRLFRPFDLGQLTWARLCVASRAFALTIDGIETTALVPFGDMVNHRRDSPTSWTYDEEVGAFTLAAHRDLAPGEEVCDSYGTKGNGQLLVQYGFCVADNDADEAELRFPDPAASAGDRRFRMPADPAHASSRRMLDWLIDTHGVGAEANAALAAAARAALARYPTTLEEDDALLSGGALSADARNCVLARRGEKRVLYAWLARTLRSRAGAPAETITA